MELRIRDVGVAGSNPVTPTTDSLIFFPTDALAGYEFQLPFFAKFSDATQARAGRKRTRSAPLACALAAIS